MKRQSDLNEETQDKNQKISETILIKEETSLLLSMVDLNILQNIFTKLVDTHTYFSCCEHDQELKIAFTLLLNFSLSCKLFSNISKQKLFPLTLNNIKIDLNYKKYLKILFMKQGVEKTDQYKKKNIHTILYHNCVFGYFGIINTLINYGADINYKQEVTDHTCLAIACFLQNISTIKKLIENQNLNVNQVDQYGMTILMWIAFAGNEDICNELLSRKDIDISIQDFNGKTALDWAKRQNPQIPDKKPNERIIHSLENHQN